MEKAKCLYNGPVDGPDVPEFDIDQLTALASVDNRLMKYEGLLTISNMEVYNNGCINLNLKNRTFNQVTHYVTIRPSVAEKVHYDQLAAEHGQAD